jgi:hypothetical protein
MEERMEKRPAPDSLNQESAITLGSWLGRHQAFSLIANRCSAADAECLKQMRDGAEYKRLGMTWEEFCEKHAGITRRYADRLIRHLEEFGANYFRLAELMEISAGTYRLIAGAVSDEGIELQGEKIPIRRENRRKILQAVQALREHGAGLSDVMAAARRLNLFIDQARKLSVEPSRRTEAMALVEHGLEELCSLARELRRN